MLTYVENYDSMKTGKVYFDIIYATVAMKGGDSMKSTGICRPVDELGRVVIPKEIRKTLGISVKDLMEIYMEGDSIILRKNEDKCTLCGNEEDLVDINDKKICRDCIRKLNEITE